MPACCHVKTTNEKEIEQDMDIKIDRSRLK